MKFRLIEGIFLEDINAVKKNFPNIPDNDFYELIKIDPTYKDGSDSVGAYGKWLLSKYKKDNPLNYSDIKDYLVAYDRYKKNRNYSIEKDINKFKTVNDLYSAVDNVSGAELSHRQEVRNRQQARKNANLIEDADIVYEDSQWGVYVPKTYAASCKLGQGANWCTASTESDSEYKDYSSTGTLYIIIGKNKQEKYQLYVPSDYSSTMEIEFRNSNNGWAGLGKFLFSNKGLFEFFKDILLKAVHVDVDNSAYEITANIFARELSDLNDYYYSVTMLNFLFGETQDYFDEVFEENKENMEHVSIETYDDWEFFANYLNSDNEEYIKDFIGYSGEITDESFYNVIKDNKSIIKVINNAIKSSYVWNAVSKSVDELNNILYKASYNFVSDWEIPFSSKQVMIKIRPDSIIKSIDTIILDYHMSLFSFLVSEIEDDGTIIDFGEKEYEWLAFNSDFFNDYLENTDF